MTILSTSSSNLYRLAAKAVLFLVLAGLPVSYAEYRIRHTVNNDFLAYKYRYDEIFNHKTKSDVLILGTSRGAHAIIPKIVAIDGHETYNFCFNGAAPSYNFTLYKDIISKYYPKPKLIIYEVNSFMFDSKLLWRTMANDYKYMPMSKAYEISQSNSASIMMPYDYLRITHESDIFRALKLSFNNKKFDNILIGYYDNGFVPDQTNFNPNDRVTEIVNNRREMDKFAALVQLIRSQQIALLFVETPEYLAESPSVTGAAAANNAWIRRYAKAQSIEFLNYNESLRSPINGDQSLYSDPGHLNHSGARAFSRTLSTAIKGLTASNRIDLSGR